MVLPPSKVTTAAIAREAGVDPALIRYHFDDRQHLLLAVVEAMLADTRPTAPKLDAKPAERLAGRARAAMQLARSAHSMQRLMVEELASAKSPEIRARISAMNAGAISNFAGLFAQENPDPLVDADPLFVFMALIGLAEIFVTAEPLIRPLVPAGTDFSELTDRYTDFMVKLVLDGLRPR
jgi:AcrR family transcriptional regulator